MEHVPGPVPGCSGAAPTGCGSSRPGTMRSSWSASGRVFVCPRLPRLRMLEGLLAFRNAYPMPVSSSWCPRPGPPGGRRTGPVPRPPSRRPLPHPHLAVPCSAALVCRLQPEGARVGDGRRRPQHPLPHRPGVGGAPAAAGGAAAGTGRLRRGHHRRGARPDRLAARLPGRRRGGAGLRGGGALFSDGDLATDETAEEVAASLRGPNRGDYEDAAEHYGRVAARWAHAQSLTFAS